MPTEMDMAHQRQLGLEADIIQLRQQLADKDANLKGAIQRAVDMERSQRQWHELYIEKDKELTETQAKLDQAVEVVKKMREAWLDCLLCQEENCKPNRQLAAVLSGKTPAMVPLDGELVMALSQASNNIVQQDRHNVDKCGCLCCSALRLLAATRKELLAEQK